MAKTSFLKLVIVIWSVTPIFYCFLFVSSLTSSVFVYKEILITQR